MTYDILATGSTGNCVILNGEIAIDMGIPMKKLRESGYISMAGDGTITLNESGLEIATRIYGRHKTITQLFELLGVDPAQAAEDACKVEHDLSDETFNRICAFINERTGS